MTDLEELKATPEFRLTRTGRFVVVELRTPHRVLSTSTRNGGQRDDLRFLANHQSCEGSAHVARHDYMTNMGLEAYHDAVCAEVGIEANATALMGTAANMNYVAVVAREDGGVEVTAIVTAGVQGNASCAGDPAAWRETEGKWEKIPAYTGTINTMLLINRPLTHAALARAVVTMTEAKSAALHRLAVGSLYSPDEATGTGTDQFCLAAPLEGGKPLSSTSPHVKLGELIGVTVREATREALRWQNGLEASYTRSIFHALGRYGLTEEQFLSEVCEELCESDRELLRRNGKAVFFEPLVAASAYSFAAVLDRIRYGTLPAGIAQEALVQSAAALATNVCARQELYFEFKSTLRRSEQDRPLRLIARAVSLGWAAKWR